MPCQQDNLYRSERGLPEGRVFKTQPELQRFVDELHNRLWHNHEPWGEDFPQVARIEAFFRSQGNASIGGFDSSRGAGIIEMLPPHRNELVVCHEIAHVLAEARYGSHSHDPWFARTYLNLVYSVMGSEAYAALYETFKAHGIDFDIDG